MEYDGANRGRPFTGISSAVSLSTAASAIGPVSHQRPRPTGLARPAVSVKGSPNPNERYITLQRVLSRPILSGLPRPPQLGEQPGQFLAGQWKRNRPSPTSSRHVTSPSTLPFRPGYRKDHIVPLACRGPDTLSNLQWQTIAGAKVKYQWERKACAS